MSKKKIILVGVLFGIVILGLIIYLILSLTTDIFKPTSEMFTTYLNQNVSKINEMLDLSKEQEYLKTLNESNYREDTKINLNYTNSKGNIENFGITSNGITNNSEQNSYKTIDIKYGENFNIMNMEYIRQNQTYGLLFSNVVKQFISANVDNIENLLDMIGVDKTGLQKYEISAKWDFITNQKENLENVVGNFLKNINSKRYKKQKNVRVSLNNGEEKVANLYSLTLSKEETKELYLEILKELGKQQEINEINTTKRLFSETEILIYVSENKTIRMSVEVENKQVRIDFYENELNIKYNDITSEEIKTISIDIKKDEQNKIIEYSDSYNNNIKLKYSLNEDVSKKNAKLELNIQNDYIKEMDFDISQSLETSNSTIEGIQKNLQNESNVNISNLKTTDRNNALNGLFKRIDSVLTKENNKINSEILNIWINCNKSLEEQYQDIKEKQKKIFNNQFLSYKGQDVKKEIIYNLLELAGRNMKNYEKLGEDSFRISISEGTQNTKLAEEIMAVIEKSEKSFNIDFGYDSEGKLNMIIIKGYEKEN